MQDSHFRREPCIALIADIVKSRQLKGHDRAMLQDQFQRLVTELNKKYSQYLIAKFVITVGDEFQGLLQSGIVIPDLIWDIEVKFFKRDIRIGVGLGLLHTTVPKLAINVDGPALHNARAAIMEAKEQSVLGGVFNGFGTLDPILNGLVQMLWFHRSIWTGRQRQIISLLREGLSISEIAKHLNVSRQGVSKQGLAAGWRHYAAGEKSLRIMLQNYVDPMMK